jgi:hypothetical protein
MIPIYMMTNDQSMHILPAATYFFNKFWPSREDVTILCFNGPKRLPNNFHVHRLGKQSSFSFKRNGRTYYYWSNSIIPFFRKIKAPVFILLWDEHLIIKKVNAGLLNEALAEVVCKKVQKVVLDRHLNKGKFSKGVTDYSDGLVELNQKTMYRTTLMPSIWHKNYFMRHLRVNMTAWDFEVKNIYRSLRDKARILAPKAEDIVTTYNVYIKGRFAAGGFKKLRLSNGDRKRAMKHIRTHGSIYL